MKWLHEYGLVSNLDDYEMLPLPVLEDARLLMEAQAIDMRRERADGNRR